MNKQIKQKEIMKKLITTMLMTIVVTSGFGQDELPNKRMCLRKISTGGYMITPERPSQPTSLDRTDGHYFNIIPAIQGNKKEIETDTLTNQEIDSRRYMYDEITKTICATFKDDDIWYCGNEGIQFKEFLYDRCYECIDNGNDLYCEIYYYYNGNDNRLTKWEKETLVEIDEDIQNETRRYKENYEYTKNSTLKPADKQRFLNDYTRDYQSSLKNYEKRRKEIMDNHINLELSRATYVRDIIYKSYPARIKYIRVTDPAQKNKITIVISNYKDEYRKN